MFSLISLAITQWHKIIYIMYLIKLTSLLELVLICYGSGRCVIANGMRENMWRIFYFEDMSQINGKAVRGCQCLYSTIKKGKWCRIWYIYIFVCLFEYMYVYIGILLWIQIMTRATNFHRYNDRLIIILIKIFIK